MIVYLRYHLNDVSEAVSKKLDEWLKAIGVSLSSFNEYVFAEREEDYYDDEPAQDYYLRQAEEDCKVLRELVAEDFVLNGVIDTSFTAGEYMNFRIEYHDGIPSILHSDWYYDACLGDFEDYEDFCDTEGKLCTEEEFEEWKNRECYILEKEGGNVLVEEVPLEYKR